MAKLTDVTGIGPATAKLLSDHKIKTVEALASISMPRLVEVPGFSEVRARATIKAAVDCLRGSASRKSADAANNAQITEKKRTDKKTITSKSAAQPEEDKLKSEKKKKNKQGGKKGKEKNKDKKKNKKDKGKGKKYK